MKTSLKSLGLALFALMMLLGVGAGCQTNESDNLSSRPWNSPRGWESGLPSTLNEGR